jgi:hypothetical protein
VNNIKLVLKEIRYLLIKYRLIFLAVIITLVMKSNVQGNVKVLRVSWAQNTV